MSKTLFILSSIYNIGSSVLGIYDTILFRSERNIHSNDIRKRIALEARFII